MGSSGGEVAWTSRGRSSAAAETAGCGTFQRRGKGVGGSVDVNSGERERGACGVGCPQSERPTVGSGGKRGWLKINSVKSRCIVEMLIGLIQWLKQGA
jgi:hypothetical protein